ncbi:XTP/dITP diphosphatase [Sediminibacillus dalangtanensis]|uniref:dITP/XTP pyrophosphatase n=1 Tax=Sediminibacillus dalangtanensis TaxID=2729421 RepID=A0ABX7VWL2_9BACI|nr:XTP/dITP diphosphatase [Sediminibacillus dalangtanensis]QTM99995.1 XTP/dITP diphosphatase [Sediminibacillus dalangtanensis]
MEQLIIATKNKGKVKDFRNLFSKYGITIRSLLDLDESIPDIEETGETFEENAALKAETIAERFSLPVLADDSGLEVDALEGRPGIFSARYAGLEKSDQANVDKLLEELKGVPKEERTARFVCVLAVARPGKTTIFKRGTCEGWIAERPIGENGFGYDPVFYPNRLTKTMAELTSEEKNQISHRKNAIVQLDEWLKDL